MARRLRVGTQGRIVLPADVRRAAGLVPGDEVAVRAEERRIVIERRDDLLRRMQDELRDARGDRSLTEDLLAERRRQAAAEAAD